MPPWNGRRLFARHTAGAALLLLLHTTNSAALATSSQSPAVLCVERLDATGDQAFSFIIEVRPVNAFSCDNWTLDVRRSSNPPAWMYSRALSAVL
jgi:hypothetical protein